jgi:NAD(P)H-dependent FMN reductase
MQAPVLELRAPIAKTNALLICAPEYIHAMPAVLKNLLEGEVSSADYVEAP